MLPNPTLRISPSSGFVPFSPAGLLDEDDVLEAPAAPVVARRARIEAPVEQSAPAQAPVRPAARVLEWQPASTLAVRRVEMAVLAAVCAYFSFGLVKVLGLF